MKRKQLKDLREITIDIVMIEHSLIELFL